MTYFMKYDFLYDDMCKSIWSGETEKTFARFQHADIEAATLWQLVIQSGQTANYSSC